MKYDNNFQPKILKFGQKQYGGERTFPYKEVQLQTINFDTLFFFVFFYNNKI